MNAEIIAVGSELLLGQIANTNGQYISKELALLGIDVYRHTVVGDNAGRLREALAEAEERADIVILTGGLGPTDDDLTRETVAAHLGKKIAVHSPSLENIETFFAKSKRAVTPSNRKQAHHIVGSNVFMNKAGLACGMACSNERTHFLLLPGPPREMKAMIQASVKPYIKNLYPKAKAVRSRVLRFFGIGESSLEDQLKDLIETQTNPTLAPLAEEGEVTLRLTIKEQDRDLAIKSLDDLECKVRQRVGNYLYGYGEDTLMGKALELLKEKEWTVAAAESLTGGLFSQELTSLPGASSVFAGGAITYTNEVKENVLGIDSLLLERDGAVSENCAKKMAEQVKEKFKSSIGISFTGVAGPGAHEGKLPGDVWVGVATPEGSFAKNLTLSGSRSTIRIQTVKHGAHLLLKV